MSNPPRPTLHPGHPSRNPRPGPLGDPAGGGQARDLDWEEFLAQHAWMSLLPLVLLLARAPRLMWRLSRRLGNRLRRMYNGNILGHVGNFPDWVALGTRHTCRACGTCWTYCDRERDYDTLVNLCGICDIPLVDERPPEDSDGSDPDDGFVFRYRQRLRVMPTMGLLPGPPPGGGPLDGNGEEAREAPDQRQATGRLQHLQEAFVAHLGQLPRRLWHLGRHLLNRLQRAYNGNISLRYAVKLGVCGGELSRLCEQNRAALAFGCRCADASQHFCGVADPTYEEAENADYHQPDCPWCGRRNPPAEARDHPKCCPWCGKFFHTRCLPPHLVGCRRATWARLRGAAPEESWEDGHPRTRVRARRHPGGRRRSILWRVKWGLTRRERNKRQHTKYGRPGLR